MYAQGRGGTTRGRGAGSGQRDGHASGSGSSTKQPILDLAKYVDKSGRSLSIRASGKASERGKRKQAERCVVTIVRVKFSGGRECTGTLKGYDQLLNLVLDNVEEQLRGEQILWVQFISVTPHNKDTDPETLELLPDKQRTLGLVVIRGTALVVINPVDGLVVCTSTYKSPFSASHFTSWHSQVRRDCKSIRSGVARLA